MSALGEAEQGRCDGARTLLEELNSLDWEELSRAAGGGVKRKKSKNNKKRTQKRSKRRKSRRR